MNLDLHKSHRNLIEASSRLRSLQLSDPGVASRFGHLMHTQSDLERQMMQRSPNQSGQPSQPGQLGFLPLLVAGGVAATGLFAWLTTKQLTESTDYNDRLKCVRNAMDQGHSESEAIKICGLGGGLNFTPLAIAGVAAIVLVFLFEKT